MNPSVDPNPDQFPLKTLTGASKIDDVHTDIAIIEFSNQIFVIATQLEKIGTCLSVKREESQRNEDDLPLFNVRTLLGVDEPEIHVIGRLLAEKLNSRKPLLFSVALKNKPSPSTTIGIVDLILRVINRK